MPAVPVTLTVSLGLALVFVLFFLWQHGRAKLSSAERDSLLPLREDAPGSRLEKPRSTFIEFNDKVVRQFLLACVVWGAVGMLVGVLIALQLNFWQLNFNTSWLT